MGNMDTTKGFNKAALAALPQASAASATAVDSVLETVLPQPHGPQGRVQEAMRYATFAGGKRLRPFLVLHSARLFGVDDAHSLRVGSAIEVLHTYSLVHDDLPCMDDDDLRRGRPTTHIAFDEMTAVLAEASGHDGMIGGQVIDMLAEESFGLEDVVNLQRLKTGQLFEFSCEAGPILGNATDRKSVV